MNVYLTIDVETYTGDYDRDVYGHGLGLPFIMDECRRHRIPATFFVETLGITRWGDAGVKRVCGDLLAEGHDVQLHVHPVVARLPGFTDRDDILLRHDRPTQERVIGVARDLLAQCTGRPVTAFRAGDFAANRDTLEAMAALGLWIGSNRNLDRKTSIRSGLNDVFPVRNDWSCLGRMVDLPVSALRSPLSCLDGTYRHLQVSAVGCGEMTGALERMEQAGYGAAAILTHPGEYFRPGRRGLVPILKNRDRLGRLLAFLAGRASMRVSVVSACGAQAPGPAQSPPELAYPLGRTVCRVVEQAVDRLRAAAL